MDITRLNKGLQKVKNALEDINNKNTLSSIEKDLLLAHIRDLYEAIKEVQPSNVRIEPEPIKIPSIRLAQHEAPKKEEAAPTKTSFGLFEKTTESKVEKAIPELKEEKTPEAASAKTNIPSFHEPISLKDENWDEQMQELFLEDKATDLNEKISMTPIKDISTALGINERIGVLSELFNKDEDVFRNTLHVLNKFSDFESAKQLLLNAAYKYNWTKEEKQKRAIQFIKTVRRRYL
jgi:hypothetical protein